MPKTQNYFNSVKRENAKWDRPRQSHKLDTIQLWGKAQLERTRWTIAIILWPILFSETILDASYCFSTVTVPINCTFLTRILRCNQIKEACQVQSKFHQTQVRWNHTVLFRRDKRRHFSIWQRTPQSRHINQYFGATNTIPRRSWLHPKWNHHLELLSDSWV